MNKLLSILATASIAALAVQLPSQANPQIPHIGAQITVSGYGSGVGLNGKIGVADNISVRPHASFLSYSGTGGGNITNFGAAATYELNLDPSGNQPSKFTPYAGAGYDLSSVSLAGVSNAVSGLPSNIANPIIDNANNDANRLTSGFYFVLGTDYQISDTIALNANYRIGGLGGFNIGGSYKF